MDLTPLQWFNLAVGTLFTSCYAVVMVQHWRGTGEHALIGGGRVTGTAWGLGMIGLVLSITLPVSEVANDRLGLVSAVVMLIALVASHLEKRSTDSDETPDG